MPGRHVVIEVGEGDPIRLHEELTERNFESLSLGSSGLFFHWSLDGDFRVGQGPWISLILGRLQCRRSHCTWIKEL